MQAGAQQGDAIMAEAASRLACWVCWLRHDGLLGSALGSRNGAKEEDRGVKEERELTLIFLKLFN